ncbi:class II aldolase/adducin family protein [Canibacter zhuwentaonis]|uniref:class II aldolase/adducin family protein n=1 Tax=Canibacter zhuwentaonis TaxID=2837491 RepID=UPI00351070B5
MIARLVASLIIGERMVARLARNTDIAALIEAGRDASSRGLVLASAGNMSVRLADGLFAITGSGVWFDELTVESFAVLDAAGRHHSGVQPSSEWKLHQRVYAARPDVNCVIHLHPQTATLLATLGCEIRLLTLDHASYLGSIGVSEFFDNGSDELADAVAAQLGAHNCVLMKHHGCTVVADTVEMAYRRALNLESAAQMTVTALQLGDENTVFPVVRRATHA